MPIENDALRDEIARRAYVRFCERGGLHGNDVADWLGAEREVLAENSQGTETRESGLVDASRRRRGNSR